MKPTCDHIELCLTRLRLFQLRPQVLGKAPGVERQHIAVKPRQQSLCDNAHGKPLQKVMLHRAHDQHIAGAFGGKFGDDRIGPAVQ
jgi:hypothetical protein